MPTVLQCDGCHYVFVDWKDTEPPIDTVADQTCDLCRNGKVVLERLDADSYQVAMRDHQAAVDRFFPADRLASVGFLKIGRRPARQLRRRWKRERGT